MTARKRSPFVRPSQSAIPAPDEKPPIASRRRSTLHRASARCNAAPYELHVRRRESPRRSSRGRRDDDESRNAPRTSEGIQAAGGATAPSTVQGQQKCPRTGARRSRHEHQGTTTGRYPELIFPWGARLCGAARRSLETQRRMDGLRGIPCLLAPFTSAPTYSHGEHANYYEPRSHAQPPLTRSRFREREYQGSSHPAHSAARIDARRGASAAGDALI